RRALVEAVPKVALPVPSLAMEYVAPVMEAVPGLPLLTLAACPVTVKSLKRPCPVDVRLKIEFRAEATEPLGNSRLTSQYDPFNEALLAAAVGAGTAAKRSKVVSAEPVSVLDPSTASGPKRALMLAPERMGLSRVT